MEFFAWSFFLLAVLQLSNATTNLIDPQSEVAEDGQESVVREKRKIVDEETLPKKSEAISKLVDVPADDIPTLTSNPEVLERMKKDACSKHPQLCNIPTSELLRSRPDLFVYKEADPAVAPFLAAAPGSPPMARTVEPIYSFGPVNVNSPGYSSGFAYKPSGYSSGYSSSSLSEADAAYGSQGNIQFHAVVPLHHRYPSHHHSLNLNREYYDSGKPNIVYYAAPEPIYVETNQASLVQSAPVPTAPSTLYCKSLKSHEVSRALEADKKVNNSSVDEKDIEGNIQRFNEIREEMNQLNQAAQKLIEQQEKIARAQQEHLSSGRQAFPPFMRTADPLQRHQESYMRISPLSMYGSYPYMPQYYREEDSHQGSYGTPLNNEEKGAKDADQKKESASPTEPSLTVRNSEEMMRQGFYPHFMGMPMIPHRYMKSDYYPMEKSETGFPVPLMIKSNGNALNYPSTPADLEFFKKMVESGQNMGVIRKEDEKKVENLEKKEDGISKNASEKEKFIDQLVKARKDLGITKEELEEAMEMGKKEEKKTKSENVLDDLEFGADQPKKKQDKRGLIGKE